MGYKEELEIIEDIIDYYENPITGNFDPEKLNQFENTQKDKPALGDFRINDKGQMQFCNKVIQGIAYWSDLNI